MSFEIKQGDCLDVLRTLPDESVQCCVTSPPYWGLRDYGVAGQLGLERTPEEYVSKMVEVFREVRRVLRKDGTLWLNLGDSYSGGGNYRGVDSESTLTSKQASNRGARGLSQALGTRDKETGCKPKDLVGVPWAVAFALRSDGWYLRQDIIWAKPNPMPESVRDRCTKSHEYIFLLSKSERYYYDQRAIAEPVALSSYGRLGQDVPSQTGSPIPGKSNGNMKAAPPRFGGNKYATNPDEKYRTKSGNEWKPTPSSVGRGAVADGNRNSTLPLARQDVGAGISNDRSDIRRDVCSGVENSEGWQRNKRSVWTVTTQPFPEAHFATFPPEIPEICIKAGTKEGDTVLDPFNGAGTTGLVATRLMRNYIGIELNPEYVEMANRRIVNDAPLFNGGAQ